MSKRGWRDPVKERLWRDRLQRQQGSGLSVREFCVRHCLAETAFYFWRAEIERRNSESGPSPVGGQRSPRERVKQANTLTKKTPAGRSKFLPVAVTNLAAASPVEITLPSGIVLRVGRDCDRKTLRTVLGAVLRSNTEAPAC